MMRKRLALLWTPLVVAAALALPASAAAASGFEWESLQDTCTTTGGGQGYGKSVLNVRQVENGKSGATQFRARIFAQYKYPPGWDNRGRSNWVYSSSFGNTDASNSFEHRFVYHWESAHEAWFTRVKWVGEWLNSAGNVVAYATVKGTVC